MGKIKTSIGILIDESASMGPRRDETIAAVNAFIEEQAKVTTDSLKVSVAMFDQYAAGSEVRFWLTHMRITDVPEMTEAHYCPRGNTPLLDAVGKMIHALGEKKRDRYIMVVLTDGEENASTEYTLETVRSLIKEREDSGIWSFVFLGAGVDAWAQASSMGSGVHTNSASYAGRRGETQSYMSAVGQTVSTLRSTKDTAGTRLAADAEEIVKGTPLTPTP